MKKVRARFNDREIVASEIIVTTSVGHGIPVSSLEQTDAGFFVTCAQDGSRVFFQMNAVSQIRLTNAIEKRRTRK